MTIRRVGEAVWQVTAGAYVSNSYLWRHNATDELLLIDTGLDAEPIKAAIVAIGGELAAVVCTHGHFDHIGTASLFQREFGVDVFLHAADLKIARTANFLLMAYKIPGTVEMPRFTTFDGASGSLPIAGAEVRFRHMAGHTPGSCFITVDDVCFTGDTLYAAGVGLSKTPGEQPEVLRASLRDVMDDIPSDMLICPGHGPAVAFGDLCRSNAALHRFLQPQLSGERC